MNHVKTIAAVIFLLTVCQGICSAQQFTVRKRTIAVLVEENRNCPQGISVSTGVGSFPLCADYPTGISEQLKQFTGSVVNLRAWWTFGTNSRITPLALGGVLDIQAQASQDYEALMEFFWCLPDSADDVRSADSPYSAEGNAPVKTTATERVEFARNN